MKGKLVTTINNYSVYIIILIGVFAGTFYSNAAANINLAAISFLQSDYLAAFDEVTVNAVMMWGYILQTRLKDYILLLVFGLTSIYRYVFSVYLIFAGICASALLSFNVMRYNLSGIIIFIISVLPQYVFYAIALFMQRAAVQNKNTNIKIRALLVVFSFILLILGTYTEAYINPVLLKQLYRILY